MEDYVTYKDLEVSPEIFDEKIRNFMKMYNYSVNAQGIFNALKFMYYPPVDSFNRTVLRKAYVQVRMMFLNIYNLKLLFYLLSCVKANKFSFCYRACSVL